MSKIKKKVKQKVQRGECQTAGQGQVRDIREITQGVDFSYSLLRLFFFLSHLLPHPPLVAAYFHYVEFGGA